MIRWRVPVRAAGSSCARGWVRAVCGIPGVPVGIWPVVVSAVVVSDPAVTLPLVQCRDRLARVRGEFTEAVRSGVRPRGLRAAGGRAACALATVSGGRV
jgi:hypothetical protein